MHAGSDIDVPTDNTYYPNPVSVPGSWSCRFISGEKNSSRTLTFKHECAEQFEPHTFDPCPFDRLR